MNEILKIIEERELYVHLILAKLYLTSYGRTDVHYNGNIFNEMKSLFDEEFNEDVYKAASDFLISENFVKNVKLDGIVSLTTYGRSYFEGFVKSYQTIDIEDKELLIKKLPKKVVEFFGFAANIITVKDFLSRIINL